MDGLHIGGSARDSAGAGSSWRAGLARTAATAGFAIACALAAPSARAQSFAEAPLPGEAAPARPAADPLITGSIGSAGGDSAGDFLFPPVARFRAGAAGAPDELGLPPPEAPLPVTVSAPDLPTMIGVRLREEGSAPGIGLPRDVREAIAGIYEARGFAPFWLRDGAWNAAARGALAVLADAGSHGLAPESYRVPEAGGGRPGAGRPDAERLDVLAEAEIALSMAIVSYARDARGARLNRRRIGTLVMPALDLPPADAVLSAVAGGAAGAGAILEAYQPRAPQYAALRDRFLALKGRDGRAGAPMARLQHGPTLKIGMRDARVPLIRARLGLSPVDDGESASLYDQALADAVAAFQKERGLPGDGAFNRRTVVALAGGGDMPAVSGGDPERLLMALRINMERWRWFPHDLGDRHALVNVPEQNVKIVEGGKVVHTTAGIIGKPESPTPVFSDTMRYIVVNPSWYVPPSIVKNEILPALARDPGYAARRGYEIIREGKTVRVRQPPGESNALGRVKFMFPNDLAIYLHDTPNRSLFRQSKRALSHGCVRVDNPLLLAEKVLGNGWTQARLERLMGGKERSIRLEEPLPIHLTYFTLRVEGNGKIVTSPDVYGYDARLKTALEALDRAASAR